MIVVTVVVVVEGERACESEHQRLHPSEYLVVVVVVVAVVAVARS